MVDFPEFMAQKDGKDKLKQTHMKIFEQFLEIIQRKKRSFKVLSLELCKGLTVFGRRIICILVIV
jgi:hypothetical protein